MMNAKTFKVFKTLKVCEDSPSSTEGFARSETLGNVALLRCSGALFKLKLFRVLFF